MTNNSKNQFATKSDLQKFKEEIKTTVRSDIKQYKDEMKNYVGALNERFSDQVAVIAEQHVDIDRHLIGIKKHLGHVDQRLDKLEIKTGVLVETVAEIKEDVTTLKIDMKEIKEDVAELKTDMKEVKEEILPESIKKTGKLEHRVAALEARA